MAKKAYATAAAFKKAVDKYFEDCETKGIFPDHAGMKIALGLSDKTLSRYAEDDEYAEILEECIDRRESYLTRKMVTDNKLAQGCLNALKQPKNGGYTDRPVDNTEKKFVVRIEGWGGADKVVEVGN